MEVTLSSLTLQINRKIYLKKITTTFKTYIARTSGRLKATLSGFISPVRVSFVKAALGGNSKINYRTQLTVLTFINIINVNIFKLVFKVQSFIFTKGAVKEQCHHIWIIFVL